MKRKTYERRINTDKIKSVGEWLEQIASKILLFICMTFFCVLTYYCIRYTWLEDKGIPFDTKDNGIANVLILIGMTIVLLVLNRTIKGKDVGMERVRKLIPFLIAVVSFYLYIISVIWISYCHIQPTGDGMTLCHVAHRMSLDNFVDMKEKGYMYIFPHQYGLLSIIRFIFAKFGIMNYQVFQHINAACVPLLFYSGYKVIRLIYDKVGAILSYILLFLTCLPLFFYVPYVYGEMISITFTMVLMWQVIRFCKTARKDSFVWGTIAIVIACFVRNNSLIVLIAVGIVLSIHAIREAKIRGVLWLLIMIFAVFCSQRIVDNYYEKESGLEISEGVPYISWVRMGLEDAWTGPGWFDNTSIEMFAANDYNTEKTILAEKERLAEVLKDKWENKAIAIDFFKRKILSQWNSPGYRYIYETRVFNCEPQSLPQFVRKIYYDEETKVQSYLNVYQLLVYFFVTALTIILFIEKDKKKCLANNLLYIAIIGGVLFTIMWEAGSRYVLPYFIYMIPLAAIGVRRYMEGCDTVIQKVNSKRTKANG